MRKEAAPAKDAIGAARSRTHGNRRCILADGNIHCKERRRHSALEPISNKVPAATTRAHAQARAGPMAVRIHSDLRLWKAGLGVYMNVTAVSTLIVDGTLPVKRFERRDLCHKWRSHSKIGRGTARRRGAYR